MQCPICKEKLRTIETRQFLEHLRVRIYDCKSCGARVRTKESIIEIIKEPRRYAPRKPREDKMPKRIWDNYEEIGKVKKTEHAMYVVAAATRNGVRYVSIREFYNSKQDATWKPGRGGIVIPLHMTLLDGESIINPLEDMLMLLTNAGKHAEVMELVDEDNAVWQEDKQ